MLKKILSLLVISVLGGVMLANCSAFGSLPQGADKQRIAQSPQYDQTLQGFVNRRPHIERELNPDGIDWQTLKNVFWKQENAKPKAKLPEITPNLTAFLQPAAHTKLIWLGHSSFLINMQQTIILLDPIFSNSAAPVNFAARRFQPPVIALHDLPEIDVVVISHDHYDHLDKNTIRYLQDKPTQFVVPLGVGSHLKGWGIAAAKISELDWWQATSVQGVKFTATPAQHFSGRSLKANQTLWASWVMQDQQQTVFYSGDTGYDVHFKHIAERFGSIDLALMEVGQYNKAWKAVHMNPSEAAQAFQDLRAKSMIPVHWGMFALSTHSWFDPVQRIQRLASKHNLNVLVPQLGETVNVGQGVMDSSWWKRVLRVAQ